jgi:hypothetical protein
LDGRKDGAKVQITVPSIVEHLNSLPPAKIAPTPPRPWTPEAKAERQQARKLASPQGRSSSAQTSS